MASYDNLKYHGGDKEIDSKILRHAVVQQAIYESFGLNKFLGGKTYTRMSIIESGI